MIIDKLKKLFARQEIPKDARDLVRDATELKDVLRGLDELITRNELEVNNITREMEGLEALEATEVGKVRSGSLPERSKNNVLRKIQRLRRQMDNLEERQRIYNRNINLQIQLVGKVQALEAMDMRGVDEERIDSILSEYEEELSQYQDVMETEELVTSDLGAILDDNDQLRDLEQSIVSEGSAESAQETAHSAAGTELARDSLPVATGKDKSSSREDGDRVSEREKESE